MHWNDGGGGRIQPFKGDTMRKMIALNVFAFLLFAARAPDAGANPGAHVQEALDALGAPRAAFDPGSEWPVFVRSFKTPATAASPQDAALAFVMEPSPLFGAEDPALELVPASTVQWRGRTVVRLQHVWNGLPVFGRTAAIRVEADGAVSA